MPAGDVVQGSGRLLATMPEERQSILIPARTFPGAPPWSAGSAPKMLRSCPGERACPRFSMPLGSVPGLKVRHALDRGLPDQAPGFHSIMDRSHRVAEAGSLGKGHLNPPSFACRAPAPGQAPRARRWPPEMPSQNVPASVCRCHGWLPDPAQFLVSGGPFPATCDHGRSQTRGPAGPVPTSGAVRAGGPTAPALPDPAGGLLPVPPGFSADDYARGEPETIGNEMRRTRDRPAICIPRA